MSEPVPAAARRLFLASAILALFLFESVRILLSGVYYLNFATLGLNATAAYALLLAAPALLLLRPVRDRVASWHVAIALASARAALVVTPGSAVHVPVAGVAAGAALVLLTQLLDDATSALAERGGGVVAAGVGAGLALDAALLVAGRSVDPTAAGAAAFLLLVPLGALLVLACRAPFLGAVPSARPPIGLAPALGAGAGLGAWLALEIGALGAAHHVARWNAAPLVPVAVGVVGGLAAGAWALARAPRLAEGKALVGLHLLAAAALLDHVAFHSPLIPLSAAILQFVLVLDLGHVLTRLAEVSPLARAGAVTLSALVALAGLFALAFTFAFAYVPLRAAWEGREAILLLALFAVAALSGVLAPRAETRLRDLPLPTGALVAVLAAAGLATAAVAVPGPAPEPPSSSDSFRVLTFNVHQAFRDDGVLDPDAFVAVLREANADVVALQEADTVRFTSAHVDLVAVLQREGAYRYAYYGQPTSEQGLGGVVLSRFPIEEASFAKLPGGADNRFYSKVRLDVGGRSMWAFAVHFGLPAEDRAAQATALLEDVARVGSAPRILVGDFNSCPPGRCPDREEAVDDVYTRLQADHADAWTAAGNPVNAPAGFTYWTNDPIGRIDHVHVGGGVEVVYAEVLRSPAARAASDHLPFLVDLRLPPP